MSRNSRELFKTETQYKRWLEYESFFEKLIDLQSKGYTIFSNQSGTLEPLCEFEFETDEWGWDNSKNETHIVERCDIFNSVVWVGASHDLNKKTDKYDYLHIDDSLDALIRNHKFQYFANSVLITKN